MLLTALLAATPRLPSTNCPLTGKPPTKPTVPPTRCVGASHMSCCPDACADLNFAVQSLAVNVTAALWPSLRDFFGVSAPPASIRGFTKGNETCAQILEQLACAVQCNPDSHTGKPGNYTLHICLDFLDLIFDACRHIKVSREFEVGSLFYYPSERNDLMIVPLIAQHIPGFNITVSDTNCYSKNNTSIPVTPLCCDPLTIPATCPPGAVNMTAAKGVSGRPLDPAVCAHFPYSNATRPFPDPYSLDVNTHISTPAPLPSPPARALSPPTLSLPDATTGAPPPKAAGLSGVSLSAAALLMVVLMAGYEFQACRFRQANGMIFAK